MVSSGIVVLIGLYYFACCRLLRIPDLFDDTKLNMLDLADRVKLDESPALTVQPLPEWTAVWAGNCTK